MRVIHVAGLSGSGKTTFIRRLLPLLQEIGPAAVVKHMGHHVHPLDAGKDTTVFFDAGIVASTGIDPYKSVMVVRETALPRILASMSCLGIKNTVLEGFKSFPLPKVVIGDYPEAQEVVLKNPSPQEVIEAISRFAEYHTLESVTGELTRESHAVAATGLILDRYGDSRTMGEVYHRFSPIEKEIKEKAKSMPENVQVRVRLHKGHLFGEEDSVFMAVGADTHFLAITALAALGEHLFPSLLTGNRAE